MIKLIGGGTPKTNIEEYWNGDIPWFSVVDAPNDSDVFVLDTEKHVTQLGVDKSSTKILRTGTTIISARGTVGKCALVGEPMAMNQSCYGINGNEGISDIFLQDIKFQIYKNEGMVVSCLLDWQFIGSHFAAYSHFKPKGIQHFEFSSQARRES